MRANWVIFAGVLLCAACGSESTPAGAGVVAMPGKLAVGMRVIDENGAALAERELAVFVGASGLVPPRLDPFVGSARTDAEGRVTLAVPASMAGHTLQLVLTLEGDSERRCWTGSAPTESGRAQVEVGDVTLRSPSIQLPPEKIRKLVDDELEKRLLRSFALWFDKKGVEGDLEWQLREAALRGGDRWSRFLRDRLHTAHRRLHRPEEDDAWTQTLSAWRLAQGRPLIAKVILHPEDSDGKPRRALDEVRYEVMNLDTTEWISPTDNPDSVLFEVTDLEGQPAERANWPYFHRSGNWISEQWTFPPGATQRDVDSENWWTADFSRQFVLGPGEWIVRLRVAPHGDIGGKEGIVCPVVFDSDPFIVRIHAK